MQEIIRAYEAAIDSVMEGERSVVARINTAVVDEFRTVIDPLGADVSHYNQNPPVLWQHGKEARGSVPIGRGMVRVRRSENDIIGKCIFAKDDFSQQLFDMYRDGTLRGWSINMIPTESSPPSQEELRSRPELDQCDLIYRKWKLKEFSAVAIPGNPEALTMLVSRGMWKPPNGFQTISTAIASEGPSIGPCRLLNLDLLRRNPEFCERLVAAGEITQEMLDYAKEQLRTATDSSMPFAVKPKVKDDDDDDDDEDEEDEEDEDEDSMKRYIKEEDGKFNVYSEKGKKLGSYASKGEATKRLEQIEYFKHKDRTWPYIMEEGGYWHVMVGKKRSLSFSDPHLADEAIRFMQSVKPLDFGYHLEASLGDIRRSSEDMKQLAREYIDLYTRGRI